LLAWRQTSKSRGFYRLVPNTSRPPSPASTLLEKHYSWREI